MHIGIGIFVGQDAAQDTSDVAVTEAPDTLSAALASTNDLAVSALEGADSVSAVMSPFGLDVSVQGNLSTGLVTMPSWLAMTCATTGRTSQVSASSLITGLGANAARCRSLDGSSKGLSCEAARSNRVRQSNDETVGGGVWTSLLLGPTIAQVAASGPGGETISRVTYSASLRDDRANLFPKSSADGGTDPAGQYCQSVWHKKNSGSSNKILATAYYADAGSQFTPGASWGRFDRTLTDATHAADVWILDLVIPSGDVTDYVYAQAEDGAKYPSSALATTTAAITRAADLLTVAAPSNLAPSGYFDLDLTIAPNYANGEMATDHDLVFFDSNDRLFIQQSTLKIVMRIGGVDVVSSALTWSRETAIRVQAKHLSTGRTLIVSGATTGNGTTTDTAVSAVSLPAAAYLMGNASGPQECADLRSIVVGTPP